MELVEQELVELELAGLELVEMVPQFGMSCTDGTQLQPKAISPLIRQHSDITHCTYVFC